MGEILTAKKQRRIMTELKLMDMTVRVLMIRMGVEALNITSKEYLAVQRRVTNYTLESDLSVQVTLAKEVPK